MFHLRWSKGLILGFTLVLFVFAAKAQRSGGNNYNYLDFNQKPYYFGITLGYNQSFYKVARSQDFLFNDSTRLVQSVKGPGFNLGIITNLKIGEYFDLRFLPTLSFAERRLEYLRPIRALGAEFKQNTKNNVFVEMPFHFRYKSAPYNDKRMFVIAGAKYVFDVAGDSKIRDNLKNTVVRFSPTDFSVEFGVGIQMYFPYFIFSPEIKFSQGMSNILIFNQDLFESTVLDKVSSRGITISLHFEG